MHLLGQIVFGLVVGIIAKLLMPGRDPGGFIITALIGIAGSILGTFLGRMLFGATYQAGWIGSVIGAILLLAIYHAFTRNRAVV